MAWLDLGNPFTPATELDTMEDRQAKIRSACLVVALVAIVAIPFLWTPWIHGNDGVRNYVYCRSFWIDGDFDFTNEFQHYMAAGEMREYRIDNLTGRPGNGQAIGSAILWTPFFWVAHFLSKISGGAADGYGRIYEWFICVGSLFYAVLGLMLLMRTVAWRFGTPAAMVGVFALWWGSPLWFYMYLHPSMSHACSFFTASLLVWMYERWRAVQAVRHFLFMGLAAGLALSTRYTNGALLLVPGAFAAKAILAGLPGDHPFELRFRFRASFLLMAGGFFLMAFPQMAAWRSFYDAWLAGPRDYNMATNLPGWASPYVLDVLFSGWRGMFVWAPVTLLGLVGAVLLVRYLRWLDIALALGFVLQLWVIGGWGVWYGGASFGQRFFINFTPMFALGLAWLFQALRRPTLRRTLVVLVVLCVLWTGGLAVQYVGGIVPREDRVAFRTLAANQFTRVPTWMLDHARLLLPGARRAELPRGDAARPQARRP